ncbi:MAG TPA: anion transporter, partial [Bacillales bacterium]|nr:anion transporter [Bacillales bacterium]
FLAVVGISSLFISIQRLNNQSVKVEIPVIQIADRKKTMILVIVFCLFILSILGMISYLFAFIFTKVSVY